MDYYKGGIQAGKEDEIHDLENIIPIMFPEIKANFWDPTTTNDW